MKSWMIALALLLMGGLVSCGTPADEAVQTVETFLQAKINADLATLQPLICSELAERANAESRTFATVSNATLQNMSCRLDEDGLNVTCSGEIVAQYGDQTTTFPLTRYRVVQENGDWKWCGES